MTPHPVADPIVRGAAVREGIRLVEHLRLCFERGGVPGLATAGAVPAAITVLRDGLLPI